MHYRFAEGRAATMGGLEIALADSLEDGFRVASRLPTTPSFLWIAPFAARSETDHPYIDTRRTTGLPMMAVLHARRASAAVVVGWQEHFERHRWASCPMCRGEYDASSLSFRTSSEESQITTVAEALVAVPVQARMSIGMSVSRARAGGFDVPSSPLAPGLRRRHGDIESIRVSSTIIPLDHHSLDIVLATSRRDLQFITAYSTSYGSPLPSDPAWPVHFENEAADTYGLALNYRMRLRDRLTGGLRLAIDRHDYGAIADRATLARRTGSATAYQIGAGLVWQTSPLAAGMEIVYEPSTLKTFTSFYPLATDFRYAPQTYTMNDFVLAGGMEVSLGRLAFHGGTRLRFNRTELLVTAPGRRHESEVSWLDTRLGAGIGWQTPWGLIRYDARGEGVRRIERRWRYTGFDAAPGSHEGYALYPEGNPYGRDDTHRFSIVYNIAHR
jgi:hypothetical protein